MRPVVLFLADAYVRNFKVREACLPRAPPHTLYKCP